MPERLFNGAEVKVIGLAGQAGSGKDYLGQQYVMPLGYFPWAFAWPLKAGMIGKLMATYEELFLTKPIDKRKAMQQEGTELGRMVFGDQLWTRTAQVYMTLLNDALGIDQFVFTDARFPDEVAFIKSFGGRVYYIDAPDRVEVKRQAQTMDAEAQRHASETSLPDLSIFDGVIDNRMGRDDVQEQVWALLMRDGFWPEPLGEADAETETEAVGAGR